MKFQITSSIAVYNTDYDKLKKAINSFLSSDLKIKLYVIDNSPTDILKESINDKRIIYLHNDTNVGFGAAHNIAIKKTINNSKYHLVLNPDVYFNNGILAKIYNFMEKNNNIGALMPKVFYPDGSLQYLCKLLPTPYDWIGRRFSPFKKILDQRNKLFELRFTGYNKTIDIPYLSGCFMFIRANALKKVGLFDEKIFMYGEDTDICRRFIKLGYRTVFYPEATIFHEFQKGSHKSLRLTFIGLKSAIYYFNKWGWFIDNERCNINRETLHQLNYKK